jgi:hypothetical protein
VDSLAQAARVIDGTSQQEGIETLLASVGFAQHSLPLDVTSRNRLGLPSTVLSARVSTSDGALRSLAVEVAQGADIRQCVESTARQLSRYAPQLLWLIIAVQRGNTTLAIATWRYAGSAPRIAAMLTDRGHVVDSDAETLCALSAASAVSGDVMRHMRWMDILGRDAVTRRFFRALSTATLGLSDSLPRGVPRTDAREMALLATSRLLFLSFLETKGWLDGDFGFLANGFAECMASGGGYQRSVLDPLFFGTLNTRATERAPRARKFGRIPFLNGGLFSRTVVERTHRHSRFTDDALGALFGDVLTRYRFTAREDAATWSQAAIDPEMLGKVFESLMEFGDRKRGGVYYTPHAFVERVTLRTLRASLEGYGLSRGRAEQLLADESVAVEPDSQLLDRVRGLRILDPACGSGAFLVHALERLARLRSALGDTGTQSNVRRSVLTRSIFGVDSSPTAVWLCELRLWLSTVIDSEEHDPMRVIPLPNLDRQIRVGDSLSGDTFAPANRGQTTSRGIHVLRDRYARSTGRRKVSLGKRLDVAERTRAIAAIDAAIAVARFERGEIVRCARSRDLFDARTPAEPRHRERLLKLRSSTRALERRRSAIMRGAVPAFSYPTHFADVAESGGFDVVIGNPPWVRVHNIPAEDRARHRDRFITYRAGAWAEGARGARASSGFAGQTDLAALFLERSTDLLAANGTLGLLLPSKLWRSLAGGGARQLVLQRMRIVTIEDHTAGPDAFDAAVYPSMLVARVDPAACKESDRTIQVGVQRRADFRRWTLQTSELSLDSSAGSPWLLLPPEARVEFDLFANAGVPLFESVLQRPHLGIKTGCNEAFIVSAGAIRRDVTPVSAGTRHGEIETCMLRPLVRGETVTRWRIINNDERIIWTHDKSGNPLRELPPHAHRWLLRSRRMLERRSDSHSDRWWSLFRVESAEPTSPRVIWADFGRAPRAAVLDSGDPTVPLNTCYSVTCPDMSDALAFCAILNSDVAAAWLAVIAEPARGGYHRYLGWTVARLPIPTDWPRARRLLAPIAATARRGEIPDASTLNAAVLDAYGLKAESLDRLLAWTNAD